MDLRGLNIFIQVAELNSFTKAAEKLGYSQPTISFQIKQLEQELGIQLFDRIGHTVSLTDAGKDALSYAQKIYHMSQEMQLGASRLQEIQGEVRIAMADSLYNPLFVGHFSEFRKRYPNISVSMTTGGTDEMFRLLNHNEVDLVCTLDRHIYDTNYVIVSEGQIGVHFIASAEHALTTEHQLTLAMLTEQPFLLTEKGMSYRNVLDEFLASQSMEIHPILEMGNTSLICKLVEENVGISFLPDYVTEEAVKRGTIVRLNVTDFEAEVWYQLLHHRNKWISAQMQKVLEHLKKIVL